jgi:O-antigen/teichoic acid export membrane protein
VALRDLLGFNLAMAVIVCADRVLLKRSAGPAEVGIYLGCLDLALKLSVVGGILGTVLYPLLASELNGPRAERAPRRFLRLARRILLVFFFVVLVLILADRDVVRLVLGPAYEKAHGLFSLALVGVFVHMLGFLITPWQRARGDFASQRRAYGLSAFLAVGAGLALIPGFGVRGAIVAFLCGHTAELLLLAAEVRATPRSLLPVRDLVALGTMIVLLLALALLRNLGGMA